MREKRLELCPLKWVFVVQQLMSNHNVEIILKQYEDTIKQAQKEPLRCKGSFAGC
ncbi:hypothetical protein J2Z66_005672 [Paenibacillus eucommiae]|uniref:Uncharacterized protein n=1 Tax=Paenibacillus eucommiae TaxID=1355755 RepID=A0ABS4J4L6_9BACL|nr:hypothetical protein [Paenibacillus eucommiae]